VKGHKEKWEGELRELVSDFIALKTEARDEPALTWTMQRAIHALVISDIPATTILRRVLAMLPDDVEEVEGRKALCEDDCVICEGAA